MYTCKKTYSDIPFAHRQHAHDGHCAFVHGHNWGFVFTFGCAQLDDCGFVVDFGKLGELRDWIEEHLDHACVFNRDDPLLPKFQEMNELGHGCIFKAYVLDSCSSEGLAKELFGVADSIARKLTNGRAFVIEVEVTEDKKNSASYRPA